MNYYNQRNAHLTSFSVAVFKFTESLVQRLVKLLYDIIFYVQGNLVMYNYRLCNICVIDIDRFLVMNQQPNVSQTELYIQTPYNLNNFSNCN